MKVSRSGVPIQMSLKTYTSNKMCGTISVILLSMDELKKVEGDIFVKLSFILVLKLKENITVLALGDNCKRSICISIKEIRCKQIKEKYI